MDQDQLDDPSTGGAADVEVMTSPSGDVIVTVDTGGTDDPEVVVVVDDETGATTVFTPSGEPGPVFVDEPLGPVDDGLSPTPEIHAPDEPLTPVDPVPPAEPADGIVIVVGDQRVEAGPATEDLTGDDIPDAAVVEGPDNTRVVVIDVDHDGLADRLIQLAQGDRIVADRTRDPATGEWVDTPTVDQPVVDQPVVDQPADRPAVDQPVVERPDLGTPGEPVIRSLVIELPDGPLELGPPTEDATGDGRPDTAIVREGNQTIFGTDRDGDGKVDAVAIFTDGSDEPTTRGQIDLATGEWTFDVVDGKPVPTAPAADPGGPDGALPIPPQFQVEVDADADLMTQTAQRQMKLVAESAAQLWAWAYPDKPWPADDSGQPYHPKVLLGVIANDTELTGELQTVRQTAQKIYDADNQAINRIVTDDKNE